MRLGAPDCLDADVIHEFAGRRDGGVDVCAVVAVVGFQFVCCVADLETARVVNLLDREFDREGSLQYPQHKF